jgi:hypothetical protein
MQNLKSLEVWQSWSYGGKWTVLRGSDKECRGTIHRSAKNRAARIAEEIGRGGRSKIRRGFLGPVAASPGRSAECEAIHNGAF